MNVLNYIHISILTVPLAKSYQQPIADEGGAAKFVSLDCPQNGPNNYAELLNCIEVMMGKSH
jgi:hypothetical protein